MRNKVNNNIACRMTAILLTLVMILGTFSVAAFASGEVTEETTQVSEVSADTETAAEVTPPSKTENAETAVEKSGQEAEPAEGAPEQGQEASATATVEEPGQGAENVSTAPQDSATAASEPEVAQAEVVRSEAKSEGSDEGEQSQEPEPETFDLKVDLTDSGIPDDFSMTVKITSSNTQSGKQKVSEQTISKANSVLTAVIMDAAWETTIIVQNVAGLTSEFQQGESPGSAKKQLKLVFNDSGKEFRISLNNSSIMKNQQSGKTDTNAVYKLTSNTVQAAVKTAFRIRFIPAENPYNRGSAIVENTTDQTSEYRDMFALPGDKIRVNIDTSYYDSVDMKVSDASGKQVSVSSGEFAMPASPADLRLTYYYKPVTVNVINLKPDRGTLYTKKSQYRPGDKVVVQFKANSGYKLNSNSLVYTYMKSGKLAVEKITKGSDGKYSFIMPFYEIDIRGTFVTKDKADSSSDPSAYIEYSDDEEEEEAEEPEEEIIEEMFDVTPIVALAVAETVMTATVSIISLTH